VRFTETGEHEAAFQKKLALSVECRTEEALIDTLAVEPEFCNHLVP
jgi:hypothetical protein